jgi:maltose alpha-D-glucosyltransferase / alpha-amylase
MICVFNLSEYSQPVELDLSFLNGYKPLEHIGDIGFPTIGELPYFLTPNGYGFYIFKLLK